MTWVKSLCTGSLQGWWQAPEWRCAAPLIKVVLRDLSCSICVSNQSDGIHLLLGLNPDSSAHLIGNLILSGVDEHKLKLAPERLC